jgi:FkbM family methyltransferase
MPQIHPAARVLLGIAAVTGWLQSRFPRRPLKGLTRFSALISRLFPRYVGPVRLPDGTRFHVDSHIQAERWILFSGNYQPSLTHLLRSVTPPGGHCLDIGANLGFYTVKFAYWVGNQGRVAAFEPNPAMLDRVQRNVELNGFSHVDVVGAAVHRQSGEITFYIAPDPGKSSVNQIESAVRQVTVPMLSIDEYVKAQAWPRLDVIKMDIEGNDCNGVIGMGESLARFRPVLLFEYQKTTPPDAAGAAFQLLVDLGYQVWALRRTGELRPFDWRTFADKQTDVLCLPPGRNLPPA